MDKPLEMRSVEGAPFEWEKCYQIHLWYMLMWLPTWAKLLEQERVQKPYWIFQISLELQIYKQKVVLIVLSKRIYYAIPLFLINYLSWNKIQLDDCDHLHLFSNIVLLTYWMSLRRMILQYPTMQSYISFLRIAL